MPFTLSIVPIMCRITPIMRRGVGVWVGDEVGKSANGRAVLNDCGFMSGNYSILSVRPSMVGGKFNADAAVSEQAKAQDAVVVSEVVRSTKKTIPIGTYALIPCAAGAIFNNDCSATAGVYTVPPLSRGRRYAVASGLLIQFKPARERLLGASPSPERLTFPLCLTRGRRGSRWIRPFRFLRAADSAAAAEPARMGRWNAAVPFLVIVAGMKNKTKKQKENKMQKMMMTVMAAATVVALVALVRVKQQERQLEHELEFARYQAVCLGK